MSEAELHWDHFYIRFEFWKYLLWTSDITTLTAGQKIKKSFLLSKIWHVDRQAGVLFLTQVDVETKQVAEQHAGQKTQSDCDGSQDGNHWCSWPERRDGQEDEPHTCLIPHCGTQEEPTVKTAFLHLMAE